MMFATENRMRAPSGEMLIARGTSRVVAIFGDSPRRALQYKCRSLLQRSTSRRASKSIVRGHWPEWAWRTRGDRHRPKGTVQNLEHRRRNQQFGSLLGNVGDDGIVERHGDGCGFAPITDT